MFRKLVSNLPFSPALIHDVGFYARRLRKEEATRRLTVLFVALTLVMQSLAVFSPPESANASSEQDIIRGGVSSLEDFLARYDRNEDDVKDILSTVGLQRSDIATSREGIVRSSGTTYIMTRYGQLSSSANETSLSYQRSVGGIGVRYFSPLDEISGRSISLNAWVGNSPTIGWFAIIKSNGSLALKELPASVSSVSGAVASVKKSASAANLTQGAANAANVLAKPLDKIAYTLRITNTTNTPASTPISIYLGDALEYSSLIDAGGASLDAETNTLTWPSVLLKASGAEERTFVLQILASIPATPSGQSNPASYDCRSAVTFGETINVPIDCPAANCVEGGLLQLPNAGLPTNLAFAGILLLVVGYFYLRTRQLKSEIRIIRHNINTGII